MFDIAFPVSRKVPGAAFFQGSLLVPCLLRVVSCLPFFMFSMACSCIFVFSRVTKRKKAHFRFQFFACVFVAPVWCACMLLPEWKIFAQDGGDPAAPVDAQRVSNENGI